MSQVNPLTHLSPAQRHQAGALLNQQLHLLGYTHLQLSHFWDQHGFTPSANPLKLSRALYTSQQPAVVQLSCQFLGIPEATFWQLLNQTNGPSPWQLIQANAIPLHQITMCSNAYKPLVRPYFQRLKRQRLSPAEYSNIARLWVHYQHTQGLSQARGSFCRSTHLRWNPPMVQLLLRHLHLSPGTAATQLAAFLATQHIA